MASISSRRYRAGDLVEVRSASEILDTLDAGGACEGVPFMPEMLPYIGRRLKVAVAVQKVCWFTPESYSRRLPNTVILEQLRCSGEAHGACQASCRLYWKEAWLRPVNESDPVLLRSSDQGHKERLEELARAATRTRRTFGGVEEEVYRCQFTDIGNASTPVGELEPTQYIGELRSRNISLGRFTRVLARALWWRVSRRILRRTPDMPSLAGDDRIDGDQLGLEPGELVEVRSLEQIGRTLDSAARHRGLWYSEELTPHCGKHFRVRGRTERLIDEKTGHMIELKNDCITLENVVCTGDRAPCAWFCPSEHYILWREAWLRRVEQPSEPNSEDPRGKL